MVTRCVFASALLLGLIVGNSPAGAEDPPIPLAEAGKVFGQARELSEADAGHLWGRPLYGPMLLVDPQTRFVVTNQQDADGLLKESEGVFVGTLPPEESIANTAYGWAGTNWTMLMWPLPKNSYHRGRLLMHESFHRVQDDLGLPGSNPSNAHLDTEEGRTWLRLEWRALTEALIHRGDRRTSAIADAVLFEAYRRSLFPDAVEEERALLLNEGLAEYTGITLSGWPQAILADRAAVRLEQDEPGTNFVRSFAYASGPAWGILLDEVPVDWRGSVNRESDLTGILAAALDIEVPRDLAAQAKRRAAAYEGALVMAEETSRADLRAKAIPRHKERFVDGPVLVLPFGESMRYSFNPRTAEALGDLGTVYLSARVTDEWGVLEVTEGVLMSRDAQGRMAKAQVPAPPTADGQTIDGDGWTLTLADGWKVVSGTRANDFIVSRDQ